MGLERFIKLYSITDWSKDDLDGFDSCVHPQWIVYARRWLFQQHCETDSSRHAEDILSVAIISSGIRLNKSHLKEKLFQSPPE